MSVHTCGCLAHCTIMSAEMSLGTTVKSLRELPADLQCVSSRSQTHPLSSHFPHTYAHEEVLVVPVTNLGDNVALAWVGVGEKV